MDNRPPKKISDAFNQWIKINNLENDSMTIKIKENWKEIAGTTIANYTTKIDIYSSTMYLKVSNSALRNLLYAETDLLKAKINDFVGIEMITEIKLN